MMRDKCKSNAAKNPPAAETESRHRFRIVEDLPPVPAHSRKVPGYIRGQKQLESGGADRQAVEQLRQFSIENKLG